MMRSLSQALTEEYSPLGVHVANVIIDGLIDLPGTRALPRPRRSIRSDRRGLLVSAHAEFRLLDP